jgi:NitT/TauT family transport system ATP-binding protein
MEPEMVAALTRALAKAADFVAAPENRREVASILARPDRVGVEAELILRTLDGRLKVASDGSMQENPNYLLIGRDAASRPDPAQAAWLYAQMLRWGQTRHTAESLAAAKNTYRVDLYDSALGIHDVPAAPRVVGAFSDPPFDDSDIAAYLAKFEIGRQI